MIETLISSKMRFNLLLKFFLHRKTTKNLRCLEMESLEASTLKRIALDYLQKAGILVNRSQNKQDYCIAKILYPCYCKIQYSLFKSIGIVQNIEKIIRLLGSIVKTEQWIHRKFRFLFFEFENYKMNVTILTEQELLLLRAGKA